MSIRNDYEMDKKNMKYSLKNQIEKDFDKFFDYLLNHDSLEREDLEFAKREIKQFVQQAIQATREETIQNVIELNEKLYDPIELEIKLEAQKKGIRR